MGFEWDVAKAKANYQAHGISFEFAQTAFKDLFAIELIDDRVDYGEERSILIGMAEGHILLFWCIQNGKNVFASFRPGGRPNMSKICTSSKMPRPMTPEDIEQAARADPDAQPLTEDDFKRMKRTPRAKVLRRALELTQEEFSARYHIPIGTLRDWEQGRSEPDQPAQAYLTVIARDPDGVNRLLNPKTR